MALYLSAERFDHVKYLRYRRNSVASLQIQWCGSIERTLDPVVLVGTRLKGFPSYLTLADLLTYMPGLPVAGPLLNDGPPIDING